jgi:predicted metal-dependent phosphoesterase TrpH
MFADLHLHTNYSDGTWSPEEVANKAREHGLDAIALTDHDTVEGCRALGAAAQALGIEFFPGTELTAEMDGHEIHILGYLMDITNHVLLDEMAKFQNVRQNRIREIVAKLNRLKVPLRTESVFELASCNSPGRPHIARAMVAAGLVGSLDEAFEKYLKKNRPAWVPKFKMSAEQAIELIHGAGGLAVLAHPGLNHCDDVIPDMVRAGLDGIECMHTKHSTSTVEHYFEIADKHGLLVTGGSDCHGMSKGKPLIGTVKLPYQHVEKLKSVAAQRRISVSSGTN